MKPWLEIGMDPAGRLDIVAEEISIGHQYLYQ
jgi:hypothetical protein